MQTCSVTAHAAPGRRASAPLVIVAITLLVVVLVAVSLATAGPALAWGEVLVPGTEWGGVDVYSNFPRPEPWYAGGSTAFGVRWQCNELAQRFYYAMGWVSDKLWPVGSADEMFTAAPGYGLLTVENGDTPGPAWGDLIVYAGDAFSDGHVAVVVGTEGSRVSIVEQNASLTGRATLTLAGGHLIDSRFQRPLVGWIKAPSNVPPSTTTTTPPPSTTTTLPATTTTTAPTPTTTTTVLPPSIFADVPGGHPYAPFVEQLARAGVATGYPRPGGKPLFRPDEPLWRAQFAKLIALVLDLPVAEGTPQPFGDLGPDDPADLYPHAYVAAAAEAGVVKGTGPARFDPWVPVSRAQAVTMTVRGAQGAEVNALAPPPAWYVSSLGPFDAAHGEPLRAAQYYGLLDGLQGYGPAWDPWRPITRGESAVLLARLLAMRSQSALAAALGR